MVVEGTIIATTANAVKVELLSQDWRQRIVWIPKRCCDVSTGRIDVKESYLNELQRREGCSFKRG